MQKEFGVGDLEIFLRLGRERVMHVKDMQDFEKERMLYWIQHGEVLLETRKDLDVCADDEKILVMTEKGNQDYLKMLHYASSLVNEKYSVFENILHFLKPAS